MDPDNYQSEMEHFRIKEAFLKLHSKWLNADHRSDMNKEMDELAFTLGLNPHTLTDASNPQEQAATAVKTLT